MPRLPRGDTPEYAVDVIEGARPIGSQLAAAAGLLTMLLVAMSAVEAPLPQLDLAVGVTGEMKSSPAHDPGLLCAVSGKILNWIAVQAS
jgi:hypothetical protein